jgi:hypothetical protein
MAVLKLHRRDAPPFPLDIFGERWGGWIEEAAEAASAPVDYVAAPLLAAASSLIGNRWAQVNEGWAEPPHLCCASVGDSGDGKSPGADAIYRYVMPELERRQNVGFPEKLLAAQAAIEISKARHEAWKVEVKAALKSGMSPSPPPPPAPEEPTMPRLVLSDITIEKVAVLLARATLTGVLMHRDELAGWLLGMTAYNNAARAFWNESFGGRPYCVDRVKHPEPIIIPWLAVAWHGGIQPQRLAEVMRNERLLARFIYFWPEPIKFRLGVKPPGVEWAIACLDRLRTLNLAAHEGSPAPEMVPLAEDAVKQLEQFAGALQERKEAAAGLIKSAIGKMRGLTLRLSLVLEHLYWCVEDVYGPPPAFIRKETLFAAAKFIAAYAILMAERTYGDAGCTWLDRNTTTLARWIAKKRPNAIHVREMQRAIRLPGLTNPRRLQSADRGGLARLAGERDKFPAAGGHGLSGLAAPSRGAVAMSDDWASARLPAYRGLMRTSGMAGWTMGARTAPQRSP